MVLFKNVCLLLKHPPLSQKQKNKGGDEGGQFVIVATFGLEKNLILQNILGLTTPFNNNKGYQILFIPNIKELK